eukprot:m51a1_g12716 hypothetical protein (315) ;mRNA; f:1486-2912
MDNIKSAIYTRYKEVAECVLPVLKHSKFLEEGVLTPEEFVQAGDLLVFKCKTWTWEAGDPHRAVPYLPDKNKQFLLPRNVKCATRCEAFEAEMEKKAPENSIRIDGDDDDWVAPIASETNTSEPVQEIGHAAKPAAACVPRPSAAEDEEDDDDDDAPAMDLETFDADDNVVVADPAALRPSAAAEDAQGQQDDAIARTRTYDISITYDYFYRTPKVWLIGYDENGKPLTPQMVFQDISADHANKTVTFEAHPHLGVPQAFIHPCRHAAVMKKIIQRHLDAGKPPRVDQYLILFIKFISSVIPTIEYDYTMEIEG